MTGVQLPLADELAELAAGMSPMLLSADSVTSAVEALTWTAAETIPGATGAGISLMDDQGRRTSTGATSALVLEADDLQYRLNEGPCLTSWSERRTVRVDDIGYDPRWPRWSEAVRSMPLLSSVSAPLTVADRSLGAVKVYSGQRAAFDGRTEQLLQGFCDTAALLLGNIASLDNGRQLSDHLRQALKDRDTVQLAKGIVMQREGLPEDQAFQLMVHEARATDRQLREVAARVISAASRSD
jgi:GAF domain-containing protein